MIRYKLPNALSFISDDGTPITILGSNQLVRLDTPEWVHITVASNRVDPQTIRFEGLEFKIIAPVLEGATSMGVIFSRFPQYPYIPVPDRLNVSQVINLVLQLEASAREVQGPDGFWSIEHDEGIREQIRALLEVTK
jgi:hypothetical protein